MKGALIIGAVLFGIIFLRGCVFYDRCERAKSQYAMYEEQRQKAVAQMDFDKSKQLSYSTDYWYDKISESCKN